MNQTDGFRFFDKLSGSLCVELSEPEQQMSKTLLNKFATKTAELKSVNLELQVWEDNEPRDLTPEELAMVVMPEAKIKTRSHACLTPSRVIEHKAPNDKHFTLADMIKVVEATELQTRGDTDWFGGIDVHHIFFEGMELDNGIWTISWGS